MRYVSLLVVVLSFSLSSFVAKAEIVRVPVDYSAVMASGLSGYDPTVVGSAPGGTGLYVAESRTPRPDSGALSAQDISIMTATTVGPLIRWPAGGKLERLMQNATAYYRDAFIGIRYTAHASQDGDYWTVKGVYPTEDGGGRTQTTDWSPVTYYADVGGTPSCWYSAGWLYYICGMTSIDITAYKKSQCDPAGSWTLQVYENGGAVAEPSPFTLRLEVPPTETTPENPLMVLNQNTDPIWPYDSLCYRTDNTGARVVCNPDPYQPDPANLTRFLDPSDPKLRAFSIGKKGCALTSAAMVNAYHNRFIPDGSVIGYNDAMKTSGGFSADPGRVGSVVWAAAPRGVTSWIGFGSFENSELRKMICTHGPQVLSVNGGGHFVMVVGRRDLTANSPWKIHDPAGGVITDLATAGYTLNYPDPVTKKGGDGTRLFRGPDADYPFPIYGIKITLHSPAELLITAPDGAKTGLDPISGKLYNEIPFANYLAEGYDDVQTGEIEPHKMKFISIGGGPADGEYIVQVIGTDTGIYSVDMERIGTDGKRIEKVSQLDIPTQYGETHTYAIQYSASSPQPPTFEGGYDGGGQKPADVNKFLRYSNPSAVRTSLPAGTSAVRLGITYGPTTMTGSFRATLNGVDVSSSFSPSAGGSEMVPLPLVNGSNTLVLAIEGSTPSGRIATDTDRLVFNVP